MTVNDLVEALSCQDGNAQVYAKVWVTGPPRLVTGLVTETAKAYGNVILRTDVEPLDLPEELND